MSNDAWSDDDAPAKANDAWDSDEGGNDNEQVQKPKQHSHTLVARPLRTEAERQANQHRGIKIMSRRPATETQNNTRGGQSEPEPNKSQEQREREYAAARAKIFGDH